MPIYDFKCLKCSDEKNENISFAITKPVAEMPTEAECPECKSISKSRLYTPFAVHYGMTRVEKQAGTTKQRFDNGKRMRDERDKRKKQAEPGTKDAISNEFWTGTEVERGVIDTPEHMKKNKG